MQRTHASASKERMLNAPSQRLKIRELGTPKHIWIAYHALGMTAMLQLCYHKGASMACALQKCCVGAGSKYTSGS